MGPDLGQTEDPKGQIQRDPEGIIQSESISGWVISRGSEPEGIRR